jgi:subtilisin family serine protease
MITDAAQTGVDVGLERQAPVMPDLDGRKSYIVLMDLKPVVAYDGGVAGLPATKAKIGLKVDRGSDRAKRYQGYLRERHDLSLEAVGADPAEKTNDYTFALDGYSAILTAEQAKSLAVQPGVLRVMEDQWRYPDTESSPGFLGLTDPAGAWQTGYDGRGVVVGVIDTGIWPEHPSFADDGSYSPPPVTIGECDFGNTAWNPNDAPFTCNNKLIGARQMLNTYRTFIGADADEYDSARDDDGHGTHTASTAAGNSGVAASIYGIPMGFTSGIAPRAHVVAYKGLGNLGGFTSDLAAAIDQAVADGVDVINYSIGGGASLAGGDEIAFLFAADAGVFAATSAGNSGPGAGTVGGPGTVPWITTVGANTQSRFFEGTVVLGDGTVIAGASITPGVDEALLVDAANAGGDLCQPGTLNPVEVAGKIVLCRRGSFARVAKSEAVAMAGGVGMILYNNNDTDDLFTDTNWVPSSHIDNTPGLQVKSYIAANPGTATAMIIGEGISDWPSAPSMTSFSSRGPNSAALDIIKPDLTAPGLQILAGASPTPDPGFVSGQLFQAIAGTSMSSPHVAGVFALIKQAHPDWTSAMAKSALMTTSSQDVVDNDRVSQATPFAMGAGHLDPGSPVHKGSSFQPGLVYDAGFLEYLGFLCDAAPYVFADPVATCASLEAGGVSTDATDLNLASIGVSDLSGSKTVHRTVTSVASDQGWRTYSVSVDAPPGYEVSVSPSTFKLKSGQKASYEVTLTNTGAPGGAWRFGSLTWKEKTGQYSVFSPIAVRTAP